LRSCQSEFDETRINKLLERGFLLSQVVEHWQARAIWVFSRFDEEYPRRFTDRLLENAPAVIYGCGNTELLYSGGLAVVGSRHVDEDLIDYAMAIGRLSALADRIVISGGAKGIDQAAMRGALDSGGKVCAVLSDSLERTAMNRENRNLLLGGQLVLISPYDPASSFNVGNAMQRNKLIYALSDAALVVSSDFKKGGTWSGAIEQLDKLKFVPIFIRSTGSPSAGLGGLRKNGALLWPNPKDVSSFNGVFNMVTTSSSPKIVVDLFSGAEKSSGDSDPSVPGRQTISEPSTKADGFSEIKPSTQVELSPSEVLFATVRTLIEQLLIVPMQDKEVASALNVSNSQAKSWLQRLVKEGSILKYKNPVRYFVNSQKSLIPKEMIDNLLDHASSGKG